MFPTMSTPVSKLSFGPSRANPARHSSAAARGSNRLSTAFQVCEKATAMPPVPVFSIEPQTPYVKGSLPLSMLGGKRATGAYQRQVWTHDRTTICASMRSSRAPPARSQSTPRMSYVHSKCRAQAILCGLTSRLCQTWVAGGRAASRTSCITRQCPARSGPRNRPVGG